MATHFDGLRDASFRGVPFETDTRELGGGRRLAKHEYPLRDTPYAEDLGRKAAEYPVEAYLVQGRKYDYAQARDALIKALNDRGPGTLIHPSFGEVTVAVDSFRLRESSREGGYCTFSVTFVEAGQVENPGASQNTAYAATKSVDATKTAAGSSLIARYSPTLRWIDQTLATVDACIDLACVCLALPGAAISAGRALVARVISRPLALVAAVQALFPADKLKGRSYDFSPLGSVFARAAGFTPAYAPYLTSPDPLMPPDRLIASHVALQAVLAAAGAAVNSEFTTADAALSARDSILDGIDLALDYAPDDLFGPLSDMRLAVAVDMTTRCAQLPRIGYVVLPASQPALLAAYTIYGDAGREAELVARNHVRHPGRVPGGVDLEVLSG
jgi:prophage DNA circulation protein